MHFFLSKAKYHQTCILKLNKFSEFIKKNIYIYIYTPFLQTKVSVGKRHFQKKISYNINIVLYICVFRSIDKK